MTVRKRGPVHARQFPILPRTRLKPKPSRRSHLKPALPRNPPLLDRRNLKVVVGPMFRHCKARAELRDRIQSGQIGVMDRRILTA